VRVVLAAPVSSQGKATPLHVAAAGGHSEVAKVLLAAGANVHVTSDVSGEEGERLDYRDGAPHMRGGVT
jgi:ankyrin repeat protein